MCGSSLLSPLIPSQNLERVQAPDPLRCPPARRKTHLLVEPLKCDEAITSIVPIPVLLEVQILV